METLFAKQDRLLLLTSTEIIRTLMHRINWDAQLVAIRGPRGVGKTTLMLQYMKLHYEVYSREVLYCTLDSVYFSNHTLLELADVFVKNGGKHLFLDEVHKYPTWSKEIKEVYDMYPDLKVVFSASSLLNILNADADLSRRCIPYEMQGLSFREFLLFYKQMSFPVCTLEEVLTSPEKICSEVNKVCRPLPLFKEYLQYGYYPFYLKNQLCGIDVGNVRKIKALLGILATSVPFEVDISKLSTTIGIHRNTVIEYLNSLEKAKLLHLLYADLLSVKKMQKPDKIFLDNPNLLYALASHPVKIGTARETFVVNQLSCDNEVEYGKKTGDFRVNGRYILEVGGEGKTYDQIADVPDSYILADGIETPYRCKLPIWIVGFLY